MYGMVKIGQVQSAADLATLAALPAVFGLLFLFAAITGRNHRVLERASTRERWISLVGGLFVLDAPVAILMWLHHCSPFQLWLGVQEIWQGQSDPYRYFVAVVIGAALASPVIAIWCIIAIQRQTIRELRMALALAEGSMSKTLSGLGDLYRHLPQYRAYPHRQSTTNRVLP